MPALSRPSGRWPLLGRAGAGGFSEQPACWVGAWAGHSLPSANSASAYHALFVAAPPPLQLGD
eukprot:7428824-Alexandrium_andersonii.AAC.1